MQSPDSPTPPVPHVTTEQMREVDRSMIEDYRIELVQMMENAGRNLAALGRARFLDGDPRGRSVVVLSGTGGNGGGGFVCARHLHNWGARVHVVTTRPDGAYRGVPAHQLDILRRMGVPLTASDSAPHLPNADLVVDALIGYSLSGPPHGAVADLIHLVNEQEGSVLSLDVPSGVDTTLGTVHDPAVRATATLTLALPKEGFRVPSVRSNIGELYLGDISVPPTLYRQPNLDFDVGPLFAREEIIRLF